MQITANHIQITFPFSILVTLLNELPSEITNILLVTSIILIFITIVAIAYCFSQMIQTQNEYRKAKTIIGDIVVSVKRQFKDQTDELALIKQQNTILLSESDEVTKKVQDQTPILADLLQKINTYQEITQETEEKIRTLNEIVEKTEGIQEDLAKKLSMLEREHARTPASTKSEMKIDTVIPIRKEKALAPLTDTELNVLEVIANEGDKTAPEIQKRVGLTREHTARLMKKLYEDGYLERNTSKMPYTYQLKEEMHSLLKRKDLRI